MVGLRQWQFLAFGALVLAGCSAFVSHEPATLTFTGICANPWLEVSGGKWRTDELPPPQWLESGDPVDGHLEVAGDGTAVFVGDDGLTLAYDSFVADGEFSTLACRIGD